MAEPEAKETATNDSDDGTFEARMESLEAAVEKLESGALSLDDAIAEFERGVGAWRHCQELLRRAEKRIEVLCEEALPEDSQRAGDFPLAWKRALSDQESELDSEFDLAGDSKDEGGEE
jgi:exodeoxyribonuclease VII small subunit